MMTPLLYQCRVSYAYEADEIDLPKLRVLTTTGLSFSFEQPKHITLESHPREQEVIPRYA